ncbi:hypothetical protein BDK51DRAFT_26510, partial [Blyttiomyces helicus]
WDELARRLRDARARRGDSGGGFDRPPESWDHDEWNPVAHPPPGASTGPAESDADEVYTREEMTRDASMLFSTILIVYCGLGTVAVGTVWMLERDPAHMRERGEIQRKNLEEWWGRSLVGFPVSGGRPPPAPHGV